MNKQFIEKNISGQIYLHEKEIPVHIIKEFFNAISFLAYEVVWVFFLVSTNSDTKRGVL